MVGLKLKWIVGDIWFFRNEKNKAVTLSATTAALAEFEALTFTVVESKGASELFRVCSFVDHDVISRLK